jgi:hypothetical protein
MGFQRLAVGLVEQQIGKVELHDAMQPRREFAKKLVQFPVRRDRFGNFQKRLLLAVQTIHRRRFHCIVLDNRENIRRLPGDQDTR